MAEEYISGEKYREMMSNTKGSNKQPGTSTPPTLSKPLLMGVIIVALLAIGFFSGVAYQKGHQPKAAATASNNANDGGFAGGFGNGQRRVGGARRGLSQVTAVSSSSITVKNTTTGASTTYSITANTQITAGGQTATAASIQVGDTVFIIPDTTDATQAARIIDNPNFNGAGGAAPASPTNNSDSSDNSTSNPILTN